MLPESWKPHTALDLIRLGSANDGGYVVAGGSVNASTHLLSMGLSDDWSFEEAFACVSGCYVTVFDPSVTGTFWIRNYLSRVRGMSGIRQLLPPNAYAGKYRAYRRFFDGQRARHVRRKVGYDDQLTGSVSLHTAMQKIEGNRCFLKVDIEGSEYRILPEIERLQHRFVGMAIEFHDVDLHRKRIDDFLRALNGHTLVNVHPNNGGRSDPAGDPLILEMTWVRCDLFEPASTVTSRDFPERLNQKNVPKYPDLGINFG